MAKSAPVAVIILNYKVKKATLECLRSVKLSNYPNLKIFVVDNNSNDNLEQEIRSDMEVEFIQTGDNLGYSGGNNRAIRQALTRGARYVFILNPDTTITRSAISVLVECFKGVRVGIVGPKVLFSDKKTLWYAGGRFDQQNCLGSHIGVDEEDQGQYEQAKEVDFVSGAAMMVTRKVLEQVGLFDERYFLYYEDVDFCLRAKKAGYKVLYAPEAVVYHRNALSSGLGSKIQDYFITRNRLLVASKFLPLRTRLALLREALRNIGSPIRRQALFDFLTGHFGKGSIIQ